MTLPIPFPVYGYVYNSNNEIVSGAQVVISGSTSINTTTNNDGKYMLNIQNIATENSDIDIYGRAYGEHTSGSWTVSLAPPSKKIDIILEETTTPGEKTLNTYHEINNECYIFTSTNQESHLKISDLDW